jgi:outer membrane protein
MKWFKTVALSAVLMGLFIGNSIASEIVASADVANAPIVVGLGIAMVPDYVGSDDYRVAPLPFLKYTFGQSQRYVKLAGADLSVNLLNHQNFQLGPLLRYYSPRGDKVKDDVVEKMDKVDGGFAAGGFLTFELKGDEPRNRINFTLKFVADLSDSYDGFLMDFDVTLWRKVAEKWDVFVGAGTTYADNDYMDTYFSVNGGNRGAAPLVELPNYSADSGIRDVRAQGGAIWYFSKNWLFGGLIRAQRLLGDADDSPIVDRRGDSNQLSIALFAGYKF